MCPRSLPKFAVALALGLSLWSGPALAQDSGTLVIRITGLHSDKGQAGITLYDKEEGYPTKPALAVRSVWVAIADHVATVTFTDLPYGTYAVASFHDENGNHKLDSNFIGIPTEGLAASNDARGSFGPPKFRDAKFPLNAKEKTVTLRMRY